MYNTDIELINSGEQDFGDIVEATSEHTHGPSPVLFDCDGLDLSVDEITDKVAPGESKHREHRKFFKAIEVSDMGVFKVEPACF